MLYSADILVTGRACNLREMASGESQPKARPTGIGLPKKEMEGSESGPNVDWSNLMKPVLTFDGRLSSMPGSPPILANALQFLSDLPDSNGSTISSMADEYASDDEKYGAVEVELQSAQPIPFASASRGPGRFNAQYPFRAQAQRSRPGPSVWTALKLRMSSSFEEKGGSEDLVVRESHTPQRALLPTPKYAPPSLRHFGPRTAHDTFFSGRPTTGTKPKEVTFF